MLNAIWELIGIIVGFIVLIPLIIIIVVIAITFIGEMFIFAIETGEKIAEWIVEKIKK